MRKLIFAAAVCALALIVPLTAGAARRDGKAQTYEVLYAKGASARSAHAAIKAAGGRITKENRAVGVATVRSKNSDFASDVARTRAVYGAAHNRPVGFEPRGRPKDPFAIERSQGERSSKRGQGGRVVNGARSGDEPLASHQWDMRMIHATPEGSYGSRNGQGRGVRVGVIDTGVDGSHPDIRGNFNRSLSRNFTVDDPIIDGPCSEDPDGSCTDPNDVDEDGHGTHVASTIASPLNGRGIGGVAPKAEIVNLRAGQDSGYFFLQPSVDALTYAGNHGIDVVNMSYYIDPWLFNCPNNPADTPEQQMEQRTIIAATERALNYARSHGVTLVSALGNEETDLGHPTFDDTSPDYPPDAEHPRDIDNSCVDMPTEAPGVLGISALGPSGRKSYYSDYGTEQNDLSAPGGDKYDFFGTPQYNTPDTRILAAYPKEDAESNGDLNPDGTPNNPLVVEDCSKGECAYYQYLQGTSMASPHAVGVAAVVIGKYGHRDSRFGGLTMSPRAVARVMKRTATKHACPNPREFHYQGTDDDAAYTATCEGSRRFNGFYGHGIVDAGRAAR
jgi:lantibiotic leader peptide-processing serine protease